MTSNIPKHECLHTKVYVTDSTMRRNQVPCPWCRDIEIERLRGILANIGGMLSPITHPETKQPIGFHMCFVRDEDVPMLRELAK